MSTTTIEPRSAAQPSDGSRGRLRRLWQGNAADPSWYRPLLLALLAATAVAYIVDLTASDYANSFYAAAVQAGTKSWKALFFGSLDASNFITVDKPPAALWVMDISGRIFGFSSASMLIPEVLEGVISAALLSATVKRWYGAGAGLIAALILVITPVAALMFRFNNPDALMVCLMVAAGYCLTRAIEGASTRWMIGVGACLGFAFLAKMMEAFVIVPGFALVYFIAAPTTIRRRASQLLVGAAAIIVCGGWWVAIDALWPAASRPYVDGSPDNSILNLIFDYNGIGRLSGNETGGAGGAGGAGGRGFGGGGAMFSGKAGITRLFGSEMGAQASWMIPAALMLLVAGLLWCWRRPRTDRFRAGLILWGSWLVVTGLVFSFSQGTIHTYYTVAFVPAIAALIAVGCTQLWRMRGAIMARALLAVVVAATAAWSVVLLERDSSWQPWLVPLIIVVAAMAIIALALGDRFSKRTLLAAAVLGAVACLAAPVAYTADTLSTPHTGSTPTAGPDQTGGFGGGAGGRGFAARRGFFGRGSTGRFGAGGLGAGAGGFASTHSAGRGGFGATTVSKSLASLLEKSSGFRWAAATDGSQTAASLELASKGAPVMAIGGFSGLGGQIPLAQFEKYVKAGDIHYFIVSSGGFGGGAAGAGGAPRTGAAAPGAAPGATGSGLSSLFNTTGTRSGTTTSTRRGFAGGGFGRTSASEEKIEQWVEAHYTSSTVGGETVYNLTQPKH